MKFRAPSGEIRVSNVFGHAAVVGAEWRCLPEVLHRDALAAGCICEQNVVETKPAKAETAPGVPQRVVDTERVIREALELMLARDEPGDTTADGTPNARTVSKLCGLNVSKEDVMAVFIAMKHEAAAAQPAE